MRWQPQNEDDLKIVDNLKNDDDLKNEDDLKDEDDLKNEDNLKNDDDLKIKDNLKNEGDQKSLQDIYFTLVGTFTKTYYYRIGNVKLVIVHIGTVKYPACFS